jgi:hypothetical protein
MPGSHLASGQRFGCRQWCARMSFAANSTVSSMRLLRVPGFQVCAIYSRMMRLEEGGNASK